MLCCTIDDMLCSGVNILIYCPDFFCRQILKNHFIILEPYQHDFLRQQAGAAVFMSGSAPASPMPSEGKNNHAKSDYPGH